MTKLTHYTSFNDLKSSKFSIPSEQSASVKEAELKELVDLLRNNHYSKKHSKVTPSSNQLTDGK